MPPEETPDATPSTAHRPPPNAQRWQVVLAVAVIAIYIALSFLARGRPQPQQPRIEHAADTLSALTAAKIAYSQPETSGLLADKRHKVGQDAARQLCTTALSQWSQLAEDKTGTPGDWRRLGILRFAFGAPGGAEAFQRVVALRTGVRSPASAPNASVSEPEDAVAPAQEKALWDALYGPAPLLKSQVPALRSMLTRLRLGWFESIAATQLYHKAGMQAEATRARAEALAGTRAILNLNRLDMALMLLGWFSLYWYILTWKRRAKQRQNQPPRAPEMPTQCFSRQALLTAFGIYLGVSACIGLPLLLLHPISLHLSDATAGRLNVALNLALYVPVVAVTLLMLRRLSVESNTHAQREEGRDLPPVPQRPTPNAQCPSVWEVWASLGLRRIGVAQALGTAIIGFALCQPFLLAATALSGWLFQRFPTPPHPFILWVAAMHTPLDRVVLLLQAAVAAPLVEETMFRGLLYPALRARWGVAGGVAASAALFALLHPTLPGGFLPLWVLGAGFALVYERSGGKLLPSILMHGFNNGLLLLSAFAALAK